MRQQHRQRDAHDDQKPRDEPAQVDDAVPAGLHEVVVRGGGAAAYPVGEGRDDEGRYDHEGMVLAEEGAGEDDKEEADGEDLLESLRSSVIYPGTLLESLWEAGRVQLLTAMLEGADLRRRGR